MKLDLRDMLAGAVTKLPFDYTLDPPDMSSGASGRLWGVRFPAPLGVTGTVYNDAGYIHMDLTLSAKFIAPCARCLADVSDSFSLSLEKTLTTSADAVGMDEDKLDDCFVIENGFLDMDGQLLDLLYMEFPAKMLCRPDCKGLCPTCGKDLNQGPCHCKPETDPRLAPLKALYDELTQKEKQNHS